ncbi:MAG: S8 family peptidase [Flavobacteriales bacterium]|nr:S8 family peptidase [Flavobacteriales bacterium]
MKFVLFLISIFITFSGIGQKAGQGESISFRNYKADSPEKITDFAVKGEAKALQNDRSVTYKYQNNGWHFIRCSAVQLSELMNKGVVNQIYFSPAKPVTLNDTMRIVQNVDSVHEGYAPLNSAFTGKDVIIGYVDTGIDYNHDDFKNADGSTRVLYYWDHSLPVDPELTPGKYGYGQLWDSTAINSGAITSTDASAHGTTVSGTGSGNGLANGLNKGVAPESDIIVVETNFSLPNWTLTVADAIDFIFSMADTLGKPAVVNTSVGTYLGSHDGTDPAAQVIDSLLNDLPGRIVVAAAGNSGAQGKYHLNATVTADTSFTWFEVNPSSAFGGDAVYFDLWADSLDLQSVDFAFGADNSSPFDFRGRTDFYNITSLLGTTTYDSIMVDGNKLANVEFYCEEINGVYHIEALLNEPDSNAYLYRFETVGSGEYDLWSGEWLNLSNIKSEGLPSIADFPDIEFYHLPDTLSTIVSSWTCSPNVVTVGNFQNQWDYIDYNGDPYSSGVTPGLLSANSSKGPNRMNVVKPDVCATGDLILSACPLWLTPILEGSNPAMLGPGGDHVRNGGTSMASPVIAGIAALYLEKCPNSTYQDFIDHLHDDAYEDAFTGATPNMGYGYGKVDAFSLLNLTNFPVTILGDTLICEIPGIYETAENDFTTYDWHNGSDMSAILIDATDTVYVTVTNEQGCKAYSDTIFVLKGEVPDFPIINPIGGGLITTPADSFIWYFNDDTIDDSNSQYYDPDTSGYFTVEVFSEDGCSLLSDPIFVDVSQISELNQNEFVIFPNPFQTELRIIKSAFYDVDLVMTTIDGKKVYEYNEIDSDQLFISIPLEHLANGPYIVTLFYDNNFRTFKVVKE